MMFGRSQALVLRVVPASLCTLNTGSFVPRANFNSTVAAAVASLLPRTIRGGRLTRRSEVVPHAAVLMGFAPGCDENTVHPAQRASSTTYIRTHAHDAICRQPPTPSPKEEGDTQKD